MLCLINTLSTTVSAQELSHKDHELRGEIEVVVIKDVLKDLPTFLQGQTIDSIADFDRPKASRDVIDYVLLRQALTIGLRTLKASNTPTIKITPWNGASYNRVTSNLKLGKFTLFSNTLWREDFINPQLTDQQNITTQEQLYISSSTLRFGEFEAGLYMNPDNPRYNLQSDNIEFKNLRAVSSSQWRPDWKALKQLPLKQVYDEVNWNNMMKMVQSQRADFMLVPFSREPDLSLNALGMTLMPIKGVKMALAGSRGWAISQTHPTGGIAYNAIEKGLLELRSRKVIPRAYIEAGVINATVADWKVLNSADSSGYTALIGAQISRPQTGQQQNAQISH